MPFSLPFLDQDTPDFPDVSTAAEVPDGLLCAGGDLSPARLLDAYRRGIFPWYSAGDPILWWSPDPRMVFKTDAVHLSSKFKRSLRKSDWVVKFDQDFEAVIRTCAHIPRAGQPGTWILPEMIRAYTSLHRLGFAHSVEVFSGDVRVGGLYGIAIGRMFFGESMFSHVSGGSKVAIAGLAHVLASLGWPLIDCQVENPHLASLGAFLMPRSQFVSQVARLCEQPGKLGSWHELMPSVQASRLAGIP